MIPISGQRHNLDEVDEIIVAILDWHGPASMLTIQITFQQNQWFTMMGKIPSTSTLRNRINALLATKRIRVARRLNTMHCLYVSVN